MIRERSASVSLTALGFGDGGGGNCCYSAVVGGGEVKSNGTVMVLVCSLD